MNLCLPCLVKSRYLCDDCVKKFCNDCWDKHFHFEKSYTQAKYIGPNDIKSSAKNNKVYIETIKRFGAKRIDEYTYII